MKQAFTPNFAINTKTKLKTKTRTVKIGTTGLQIKCGRALLYSASAVTCSKSVSCSARAMMRGGGQT